MHTAIALNALLLVAPPADAREAPREPVAAGTMQSALRRAGLERVWAAGHGTGLRVEGVLPGEAPEEIVLSASDPSGCAVAVAAAADLRRTPLRHTVRVVLFDDEKPGPRSRRWLTDLGPEGRRRILAALHLGPFGGSGGAGPVILPLPLPALTSAGGRARAPGWLVHAVLRSGEAVGFSYAVADRRAPLLGQLVLHATGALHGTDGERSLELGVPSVVLSDESLFAGDPSAHGPADARLDARRRDLWTHAVAAAVRRLDALAGRPVWEDRYLVACGRVWLRRDLIWAGFLLWALLVFRGRPGRWRGGSAEEHGRQMARYLPGFLFRVLLLLAILLAPVFSVLLLPAAVLALLPPRPGWLRALWIVLGVLPLLCLLAALGVAFGLEVAVADLDSVGPAAAVLIPAVLLSYAWTIVRGPRRQPRLTEEPSPGKFES
jgi:hypothetical protein